MLEISGFTTNLIECQSTLSDNCCPIDATLDVRPWAYTIKPDGDCPFRVKRRTEKGWTLDFVFNRENLPWWLGKTFYYWGVRDENDPKLYADNNLSFSFTNDGRIEWKSYRYSGECVNEVYQETYYIDSGVTPILCSNGTSKDFNITIVFDRDLRLTDCDIENAGGWNDLITIPTLTNPSDVVLSGSTESHTYTEELNKDWNDERYNRLGTLKIYLNGWPIYKKESWEEIIPSTRGFQPLIQSWGGGTTGSGNIHIGVTAFNLKRVKYIEEPLNALEVKHHYITTTKTQYDITECTEPCEETNITPYAESAILYSDDVDGDGQYTMNDAVTTDDGDILIY